ncbi:MAG TPA: ATP synthase subunit gamma [Rhodopirellula baltica]|uniref:ATP synthase gamma chain n=1 Tax=Rhodopirellula baltica (strain DSM 10527 / NCIMB 13988 / SH1) TaxID=243090 RepID=ATPG_RHOBA|nr:ATP synthase F1 subunit gamma [Rhodopirellula baltica]Q7UFB6.1 RecName: Full=ATP synthase gamma chain; AltName: Full=ATP synthase F1 sector gamma subunit; AltName: Full=F-ATPase gamma subunit [Rhodopirellula baltica SH 1]CAD78767.1 ATP synthase gamma subunit [Rhodopirellula baltica SH 1]HBE64296.1 ATP synthase subunit gamma [Rhodopirellula baltica]
MANARALDKRRKSIRNIRKITRTMELIATARYKKAMDRAAAATAYTEQITKIVSRLADAGLDVQHPLLEQREKINTTRVLVLASNRGLCGGYNASILRTALPRIKSLRESIPNVIVDASGKRGVNGLKFRGIETEQRFLQFEDQPAYDDVEKIAEGYLAEYITGKIDRLDVVYTKFISTSKQEAVIETLLPLGSLGDESDSASDGSDDTNAEYEFLPSAESILEEVVPTSFKVKLFKCFLDAAVSEQVARMIAMKGATESAGDMIKQLSMTYNRARQSQITGEIMEIIGGVEALEG